MLQKVEGFKYEKMRTKGVPFGYLVFHVRLGDNHAHSHMPRRQPRPSTVPEHGPGLGAGTFWPTHTDFF